MLTTPVPEEERGRLVALKALGVLDTPPEPELDIITELAADRFDVPIALISLVDADRQWFKSIVGLNVPQTDRSLAFCGYTILSDATLVVLDTLADERFVDHGLVTGAPFIRFYAGAPLTLSTGERVGSLCVIDRKPRTQFSEREDRALRMMAAQVVSHLETRQMRSSQRISQLIADTTSDGFICTDPTGQIIYWNQGASSIFGFSTAEAVGRSLDIIVPPEHLGAHHAGLARLTSGAAPRLVGKTVEIPAIRKDGSRLFTELTLGMWNDPDTGLPAGYAAVLRDVGQRKITEAKIAEQVAAIEAAQEGIAIADVDGINHYMNAAFLRLFGLPDGTADLPWSHLVAPVERDRLADEIIGQLADGGNWTGDLAGLCSDGAILDLEVSLTRCDKAVVCVVRDMSSRRNDEREMALLREQLLVAQRQEVIGQLASGLAHDFNNLIASISGSAALLGATLAGEPARHATRIETAATAAASLVDKMLSLGKRNRHYEIHDGRAIMRDVGDLLRASLPNTYRLHIQLDDEPAMLTVDRTELVQVLLNLGLNARDAVANSPRPELTLGIRLLAAAPAAADLLIGSMPDGPLAHFFVIDNGCGMTADEFRSIFLPFYTSKEDSGTGLGLAMVANIVTSAGGGISVRSTPDKETRFDIFWPLDPPEEAGVSVENPATQGDRPLAGLTVLVVDDEPAVVETLSAMLESAGAEVGPCVDPKDALTALIDDPDAWALLVTDYDMPEMNGAALAAEARALRPDLPILLVTALPAAARARVGERELFDAISGKLVNVPGLAAAALAAISNREAKCS